MSTSDGDLRNLEVFVSRLDFQERKALITLARSQSIPDRFHSPILFQKVAPVLNRLSQYPPFFSLADTLVAEAPSILRLLNSSLTTGIIIVYALGVDLSDEEVKLGKEMSFSKELLATQTPRGSSSWNWDAILNPSNHHGEVIHPLFPFLSPLQRKFSMNLPRLRASYNNRIILPHYSRRGVSGETSGILLSRRFSYSPRVVKGNRRTFHRNFDASNITSLDVVHHYIRTGDWVGGRTEMKQRWYPSGLLPRTYFSWSGTDIAVSSYLRNFFNDLGDAFPCTDRHNRVKPNWLNRSVPSEGGYLFYDLTSFTSWFHEHTPFLRALARRFRGTVVFLTGEDLSLTQHDLGSLIDGYTDWTTDFSEFVVNGKLVDADFNNETFRHQCAGFLGIPGNLVTCTVAHGLALASTLNHERELQVPGDDVGAVFQDERHRSDLMTCASTLGSLQFDKVYRTPQLSIYLKRLVLFDRESGIDLSPMLIYPLLPYLVNPNEKYYQSNRYRLPDRKKILSRAASVLVSFHRDFWKHTFGDVDPTTADIIRIFLRRIHDNIGLPKGAIFQGYAYGEDEETAVHYPDIPVKFPVDDDRFVFQNPDREFASRYVHKMVIRDIDERGLSGSFSELQEGDVVTVRRSKGWRFLEDMGYVTSRGIPGEKITLVGAAARDAYLFASEPPFLEVEALCTIDTHQLVASGVLQNAASVMFDSPHMFKSQSFDPNLQSWRYRRYVDLDDVKSAGFYGRSREWVNSGLTNTRASLSPEPDDFVLNY